MLKMCDACNEPCAHQKDGDYNLNKTFSSTVPLLGISKVHTFFHPLHNFLSHKRTYYFIIISCHQKCIVSMIAFPFHHVN
jgi:hypothetical protein